MADLQCLNPRQLRDWVISPVLGKLRMDSPAAIELVLGTCYQESRLKHIHQLGSGPAIGIAQMEPATHIDIWDNFLKYKPEISRLLQGFMLEQSQLPLAQQFEQMHGNMYYAVAMCRVHYFRVNEALPPAGNVMAMARYWKLYYNTPLGKGTEKEYRANWAEINSHL